MAADEWRARLRAIYDQSFSVDWKAHLNELNKKLRLEGARELRTSFPRLPPIWFNGDVDALTPGDWTLVISLNHQLPGDEKPPLPADFWDFCRLHNRNHWYWRFFRPLVRLTAQILDEEVGDEKTFATSRMAFIELCPYASAQFDLSDQVKAFVSTDHGCKIAAEVTSLFIDDAQPRLILLNGGPTVRAFETINTDRLRDWDSQVYDSTSSRRPKELWHKQGWLSTANGACPVVGSRFCER